MIVSTNDIYPAYRIAENKMLGKNGDVTFSFRWELPEIYSLGESDYDQIHAELHKFLKRLPPCIVHKQDFFLEDQYTCTNLPNKTFLQKATWKKFYKRKYMGHFCFLHIGLNDIPSLRRSYMNASLLKRKNGFKHDREKIIRLSTEIERAVHDLNSSVYFSLEPLQEHEIREILYKYINGFSADKLCDIILKPELRIGDFKYRIYAIPNLENQPEHISNCIVDAEMGAEEHAFYKGFMQPLGMDLSCNHILNQIIYIDDHRQLKEELKKKYRQFRTFEKLSPENSSGKKNLEEFLNDSEENEQMKLARAHINVIAWEENATALKATEDKIISRFKELDILPYHSTYEDYLYYFLCSIPGNAGNMPRQETFITDLHKGVNYFHLVSNCKSDAHGFAFNDRRFNIPVIKDDFYKPYESKQITARNAFIVSPTGGGKSFLLNHILRQAVEQNYLTTLIELGASYEKLFHLYPKESTYIQYMEGKPLGINPFLVRSKKQLTADKIRGLADFIFVLWKKEVKEKDHERVSLYKILNEYYEQGPGHLSFPSFFRFVKNNPDLLQVLQINRAFFDRDEFLHVTSEYAEGMFAFLLEDKGQDHYLYDKRFVGFELENIKDNMDILPIMFMMIREVIDHVIWGNKTSDKRLWFEEAAKLFKYPVMLRIIDYYFQTIRKHNGSIGIVLQSIDQVPANEIGNAILSNTHVFYILKQDKSIENMRKRLNLSTHDINQIRSIQNKFSGDITYTEFLLKMGNKSNVYRLEVPEAAHLAYLSEGKEKSKIMKLYDRLGNMEETINQMLIS